MTETAVAESRPSPSPENSLSYVSPALTTVAFPADELGRQAGRLLAELMAADTRAPETPASIVLPVTLVVRSSTSRVRS